MVLLLLLLQVSMVSSAAEASAVAPPGGSVSVVVNEGLQLLLPLAGLFDVEKELKRLDKQKQKVSWLEHVRTAQHSTTQLLLVLQRIRML